MDLELKARELCKQQNTKQCAAICLTHSCLIPLGKCPSLLEVWTPQVIEIVKKLNERKQNESL